MPSASVAPIVLADLATAAAGAVPGVAGFDAGKVGAFATYGSGRRVPGVRVRSEGDVVAVSVRLVAEFGRILPDLGAEVHDRVADEVARATAQERTQVEVMITDVVLPDKGALGWGRLAVERAASRAER